MIAIASDHAGIGLKADVSRLLQSLNIEIEDLGPQLVETVPRLGLFTRLRLLLRSRLG